MLQATLRQREFREFRISWLDNPDNLERILHPARPLDSYRDREMEEEADSLWRQQRWRDFQKRQGDALFREMTELGLIRPVLAAYALPTEQLFATRSS